MTLGLTRKQLEAILFGDTEAYALRCFGKLFDECSEEEKNIIYDMAEDGSLPQEGNLRFM